MWTWFVLGLIVIFAGAGYYIVFYGVGSAALSVATGNPAVTPVAVKDISPNLSLQKGPAGVGNFTASMSEVFSPPTGGRILIQAKSGGVWVNNFYASAKGYWPEMNAILLKKTSGYEIRYYRGEGRFEVALNARSSAKDNADGEGSLFGLLGIGKPDLCKLSVLVTDPYYLGSPLSARLSFCGSVFSPRI